MSTDTTSIGRMLLAAGRITQADTERITQLQQKSGQPFGEAAIELKLITREDLDRALSRQFDYPYLQPGDTSVKPQVVVAFNPFSPTGENLRALRSQLMLRWYNHTQQRKVLAVCSPGAAEGRSFVAANLAVVLAQQGQKVLLVEANLRNPVLDQWFPSTKGPGLAAALAERSAPNTWLAVGSMPGLSVLVAGSQPPNPLELLGRPAFEQVLQAATQAFDVVVLDTPAGQAYADAEVVAARAGTAVLVARQNRSQVKAGADMAKRLQDSGVNLVGAVLNGA